MNKYTLELNISSEDISHNPNFKFEEKLQMLKGILDEYDEIKTTSNWEIINKEHDESETKDGEEFMLSRICIKFESELKFWDHWNGETGPDDPDDVAVSSGNLLIYFDQKGGIFHEMSRVILSEDCERGFNLEIKEESTGLEIDVDLELNYVDGINFWRP